MTGRTRCLSCHSESHLDPKATRPPVFIPASAPAHEEHVICHISSSCVISSHLISSRLVSFHLITTHPTLLPYRGCFFPSHLIPAQALAPAMLPAFSKLSHLGAKLLLRTLGNSIFHRFFHFTFKSIHHCLLAGISIFQPCSALPAIPSEQVLTWFASCRYE